MKCVEFQTFKDMNIFEIEDFDFLLMKMLLRAQIVFENHQKMSHLTTFIFDAKKQIFQDKNYFN